MRYLAIDCETTGLDVFKGDRPFMISTYDKDKSEDGLASVYTIGHDSIIEVDLLLMHSGIAKVMFNAKFDIQMIETTGMKFNGPIHDVMIMAHVYNPDEPKKSLKVLAEKYCGIPNDEEQEIKKYIRKHKCGYEDVPFDMMAPYALKDAEMTYKLFEFYKSKGILEEKTYKLEMKLLACMIDMQKRGVLIDVDYCKDGIDRIQTIMQEIEEIICKKWGDVNISSNAQLGDLLFNREGLTCQMFSEAGNPVLDERMLATYDHPIIPLVLQFRALSKLKNTYLVGVTDKCDEDNVIHCDYFQVGAKTGRLSCNKPNLQNIPREGEVNIRKAFVCRENFTNLYIDYSQIELRVLAHYSQDEKMIKVLTEGGDLHGVTAKGIFGKDYTKEQRYIAKRINFGIVYGIGPKKFTEILSVESPEKGYTYSDSMAFINGYHKTYPAVKPFMWAAQRKIMERGHVFDLFGRKYPCPKDLAYRAVNYLIQGCAAGVMKNAMIATHNYLQDKKSNLLLTIHDELVFEIHKDERGIIPELASLMEDYSTFRVPLLVTTEETSTSWDEKAELNLHSLQV